MILMNEQDSHLVISLTFKRRPGCYYLLLPSTTYVADVYVSRNKAWCTHYTLKDKKQILKDLLQRQSSKVFLSFNVNIHAYLSSSIKSEYLQGEDLLSYVIDASDLLLIEEFTSEEEVIQYINSN